nr:translation initiation factor IF-2-like [Symphalangus syndactylus]
MLIPESAIHAHVFGASAAFAVAAPASGPQVTARAPCLLARPSCRLAQGSALENPEPTSCAQPNLGSPGPASDTPLPARPRHSFGLRSPRQRRRRRVQSGLLFQAALGARSPTPARESISVPGEGRGERGSNNYRTRDSGQALEAPRACQAPEPTPSRFPHPRGNQLFPLHGRGRWGHPRRRQANRISGSRDLEAPSVSPPMAEPGLLKASEPQLQPAAHASAPREQRSESEYTPASGRGDRDRRGAERSSQRPGLRRHNFKTSGEIRVPPPPGGGAWPTSQAQSQAPPAFAPRGRLVSSRTCGPPAAGALGCLLAAAGTDLGAQTAPGSFLCPRPVAGAAALPLPHWGSAFLSRGRTAPEPQAPGSPGRSCHGEARPTLTWGARQEPRPPRALLLAHDCGRRRPLLPGQSRRCCCGVGLGTCFFSRLRGPQPSGPGTAARGVPSGAVARADGACATRDPEPGSSRRQAWQGPARASSHCGLGRRGVGASPGHPGGIGHRSGAVPGERRQGQAQHRAGRRLTPSP